MRIRNIKYPAKYLRTFSIFHVLGTHRLFSLLLNHFQNSWSSLLHFMIISLNWDILEEINLYVPHIPTYLKPNLGYFQSQFSGHILLKMVAYEICSIIYFGVCSMKYVWNLWDVIQMTFKYRLKTTNERNRQ